MPKKLVLIRASNVKELFDELAAVPDEATFYEVDSDYLNPDSHMLIMTLVLPEP
jgi:hypothetical protein